MIPYGLMKDREGILYTFDKYLLQRSPLFLDKREINENKYDQWGFYPLFGTDEYIIKFNYTYFTKDKRKEYKEMLIKLIEKQKYIKNTDFPIGYFLEKKYIQGLIIRYYKNGISLDNILKQEDITLIKKYYLLDDDNIRNLFLLLDDFLDAIYEMFENGVYYTDINLGNIVLDNNKVKMIDFDPNWVRFDKKDIKINAAMEFYIDLLNEIFSNLNLCCEVNDTLHNFEEAKKYTKRLENKVRMNNR